MKRLSFLESTLFIVLVLSSMNSIQAQKLWGVGAPTGQAEGEFQNAFVQSTTTNYSIAHWTAQSISDGSGANVPGAAYWSRNTTGLSQGTYAIAQPANSNSVANGLAIFDSDFLHTGGPTGTGTSPNHQKGALISPRMDLTGATDEALIVEFYSYYRHFSVTEYSVSISVDDGVTWSTAFDIKALQFSPTNNPTETTIRALFPNVTTGVTNLTQCRVRFMFDGRYYFTMLDDVSVEIAPDYDIGIGLPREVVSGISYGQIGDIVRLSNNTHRPLINVDPNSLGDWIWGAKVVNYGTKTIQATDAPRVKCSINFTDALGATIPNVYLDTLTGGPTDSIEANNTIGVPMIKNLREVDFIIANGAGTYDVTYWVEHNNTDGSPVNDTIKHSFVITDDQGGTGSYYLTKSKVSPLNNRVYGEDRFTTSTLTAFEYGSIYSFPNGARDSVQIDSVDFVYHLHSSFAGPANQTVFVNIYEFVDGSNGGNANGSIEDAELTKIAFSPVQLTGLGVTVPSGYTLATATNFVDATGSGAAITLKDNAFYYVTVELNPSQTGGTVVFSRSTSPFLAETRLNYAMNREGSSSAAPISATTSKTVDAAGGVDFYDSIRESNTVPAIGIHLSASEMITTVVCPEPRTNIILRVVPNPVSDYLNVLVEFETPTNVQYIMTDVSGRVVYTNQGTDVEIVKHIIDVSNLPAGVYFVSVQTAEGISTKRVIRQ